MTNQTTSGKWAALVAAGILLSRIAGLVRDRAFAHYFGNSDAADAFRAAFRIPNFLQNLFGEGVLSASFIPVYAKLLAEGNSQGARALAGAIATLLTLIMAMLVLLGVAATPWLVDIITPGFSGAKRELTIRLVAILFPGTGLLVLSAWCLGILNSHRQFFLSYVAPVVWNMAIIAALLGWGGRVEPYTLAEIAAWGAVAGGALQFAMQLPRVLRVGGWLPLRLQLRSQPVRTVLSNFFPALMGRGVAQVSAYVDAVIASLLPGGALAALSYAQTLYLLPVSLFGMSISVAELPEMSRALGDRAQIAGQLQARLRRGLSRMAFFIVPSTVAFLTLGNMIAAAVYQTGHFTRGDGDYVWSILAGAALGLPASTQGRLFASTCYALRDPRTPLRFAIIRVLVAAGCGYLLSVYGPSLLGLNQRWGVAGLTLASGSAAWLEYALLRRAVGNKVGKVPARNALHFYLWLAAILAALTALEVEALLPPLPPVISALTVLGLYAVLYLATTVYLGVEESRGTLQKIAHRIPGLRAGSRNN